MKLAQYNKAPQFTMQDIHGKTISLTDYAEKKLLLCFFRYAGCPFCNLTLQQLLENYPKFNKLGLNIIAFFQSSKENVIKYIDKLQPPIPIIADPQKEVYNRYGVESSVMGWPASLVETPAVLGGIVSQKIVQGTIDGDPNLLPADFLIGPPDLTIYKAYYGSNFSDIISQLDIENFIMEKFKYYG